MAKIYSCFQKLVPLSKLKFKKNNKNKKKERGVET